MVRAVLVRISQLGVREQRLRAHYQGAQPEDSEETSMDRVKPMLPQGEAIRRAVRWISEHDAWSLAAVEETSRRFDLSPLEEEFLVRHFLMHQGIGA